MCIVDLSEKYKVGSKCFIISLSSLTILEKENLKVKRWVMLLNFKIGDKLCFSISLILFLRQVYLSMQFRLADLQLIMILLL